MRGGMFLSGDFLCFVIPGTTAAAEPALHGIPYKPDPPPAIDGRLDEWENVPNAYLIQTREQVGHGGKAWKSPQDLSAKVWLAWRGEYLYLAADVTDDRHVQKAARPGHVARRSRRALPGCHARGGAAAERLGQGQINLGLSPGQFAAHGRSRDRYPPEAVVFTPDGGSAEGILVAAQKTEKGYALEAAIPWRLIARLAKTPELKARERHAAQLRGGHLRHRRPRGGPGKADDHSHHALGTRAQPADGGGPGPFGRQGRRPWSAAWTWPRAPKLAPEQRSSRFASNAGHAPRQRSRPRAQGPAGHAAPCRMEQRHAIAAQRPKGRSPAAHHPAARSEPAGTAR